MKKEIIEDFRGYCENIYSAEIGFETVSKRYGRKTYKKKIYDFSDVNYQVEKLFDFLSENNFKWKFFEVFTNSFIRRRVSDYIYYNIDAEDRSNNPIFSALTDSEKQAQKESLKDFFSDIERKEIIKEFDIEESEIESWK